MDLGERTEDLKKATLEGCRVQGGSCSPVLGGKTENVGLDADSFVDYVAGLEGEKFW